MNRMHGWLSILLPLIRGGHFAAPCPRYTRKLRRRALVGTPVGTLGPGGPQFSYGLDYCQWLRELPHDPTNPYDDLGGEGG